jgi:nitroreductase
MDINEAIHTRRSTREYTLQTVEEAALRRLIGAAIDAPSAVNL